MRHTLHPAPERCQPLTVGTIVACPHPDCAQVAEIIAVWDWRSTTGFPAYVRTRCLARHVVTPRLDSVGPLADADPNASARLAADGRLARQEAR